MTDAPPLPRIVQVEVLDDHELCPSSTTGWSATSRSGTTNGVAPSPRFETLPGLRVAIDMGIARGIEAGLGHVALIGRPIVDTLNRGLQVHPCRA